jgi:2-polyprenyl-3-methyl-5-hydroxy-6-metoxy-1,4-benzoquinol methylase
MPANEPPFWDRLARKYAKSKIADIPGYERTLERVRHYLKKSDEVYEFGGGTGTTALRLAPHVARYLATDFSSEMIAVAQEKAQAEPRETLTFAVGAPDASSPPGGFDVVLGFNVLHLVAARTAMLSAVHAMLKPDGLFISKTPCMKDMNPLIRLAAPAMQAFGMAPYIGWFTAGELEQEIREAGFNLVEQAHHGSGRKDSRIFLVAQKA